MAREAAIVERLRKRLEDKGSFVYKTHGSIFQMAGLPDLIGCYRGLFFGFECKRPGHRKDFTKIQEFVGKRITKAGGLFALVTHAEEAETALDKHFTDRTGSLLS